jgi:hypothetical protein
MEAYRGSRHRFAASRGSSTMAGVSQAREFLGRGYEQAEELVVHNPMSSFMVLFGVGLGLGLLLIMSLPQRERSFSELSTREKAQRLGQKVRDTVAQIMPERMSSRLQG